MNPPTQSLHLLRSPQMSVSLEESAPTLKLTEQLVFPQKIRHNLGPNEAEQTSAGRDSRYLMRTEIVCLWQKHGGGGGGGQMEKAEGKIPVMVRRQQSGSDRRPGSGIFCGYEPAWTVSSSPARPHPYGTKTAPENHPRIQSRTVVSLFRKFQ